ncbi:hypothetical protein DH2020_040867 [Rehmannia glutinosa]|uniref:Uncharacterized protein n=1 Tax=Rehmannia glutinosa TaxID=99300 RepID=A0ABR0USH4_REHGL
MERRAIVYRRRKFMNGVSGVGDGNTNGEGPSNNRPSPKRPRLSIPNLITQRRSALAAAVSLSRPAATNWPPRPLRLGLAVAEESEVESETDNSLSDSSSGSEGEAEEQGIELVGRPGAVVDLTQNGDGGGSDSERSKNPRTATLMDLDVLDCPICCEPLCSPVYQHVHHAAPKCGTNVQIAAVQSDTTVAGSSKRQFVLDTVVSISMDNNQMQVFLQERSQSTLFILNRAIMSLGSFVNVVCIAPISSKGAFLYDLTAIVGDTSIKIKTGVECMPKWTVQALTKKCLIVPRDFIRARGQLKFDLIIRKNPAVAR